MWSKDKLLAYMGNMRGRIDTMTHYDILGIVPGEGDIRLSFHELAQNLHPDLYRGSLSDDEYDELVKLYARVADAYFVLRDLKKRRAYDKQIFAEVKKKERAATNASEEIAAMDPKVKLHLRRAKADLARGDLGSAELNVKMAIALEPTSQTLKKVLRSILVKKQQSS